MIDFISDCVILYYLALSPHSAWFSFSLFTMICPYYEVYTSLMNLQIRKLRNKLDKDQSLTWCQVFTWSLTVFPTMIFIVFLIDISSMIAYTIMSPFIILVSLFCCDLKIVQKTEDKLNSVIARMVDVSLNDIKGFRVQRTIT